MFDTLTGLPKPSYFKSIINEYAAQSSCIKAGGIKFALIYLDINNFKYLKETFGLKAGSKIIKGVAEYLVSIVKNPNYVSRVAQDKFAILFTDYRSEKQLFDKVDEIINNGCDVRSINYICYLTMSAGIALYPKHGTDINDLMKKAETAIYSAKKIGKDIGIYSEELQNGILEHVQMVNQLQNGIEREEFTLFYQPEYNLHNNKVVGVEALIRWYHPEEGYISPEKFIPVAEKSKQIYELERWIINKALQQKSQWEMDGLKHIDISINLSSRSLESETNFQKIEKIISNHDVDYTGVIFEITETVIISHVDLAIERLNRLRSYGIRIALDDFGTGFSSLTHIMKLPIDIIKIDRSFIKSVPGGNAETIITKNLISMAHNLKYKVVAEGIETQEQLDYLKQIDCERGQGYLLCKPMPGEKLSTILESN